MWKLIASSVSVAEMVFILNLYVKPELELVSWRKMIVKKDNRIVRALTKYWNPQGNEVTFQEVKKILEKVGKQDAKRKLRPSIPFEVEEELPPKKICESTNQKTAIKAPGPHIVPVPCNIPTSEQLSFYTCNMCSFVAHSKKKLKKHMKTHQKVRKYSLECIWKGEVTFEAEKYLEGEVKAETEKYLEWELKKTGKHLEMEFQVEAGEYLEEEVNVEVGDYLEA